MKSSSQPAKRRAFSRGTPSSTVTSGHGVASVLSAIGGLGPKHFRLGDRRRPSCKWDEAPHALIISLNLFRKRLTWQCRATHTTATLDSTAHQISQKWQ